MGAVLGANIGTRNNLLAGLLVSDGMATGIFKHIAMVHTGDLLMRRCITSVCHISQDSYLDSSPI